MPTWGYESSINWRFGKKKPFHAMDLSKPHTPREQQSETHAMERRNISIKYLINMRAAAAATLSLCIKNINNL